MKNLVFTLSGESSVGQRLIILSFKEAAEEAEAEVDSKSDAKTDFEVIDALLDAIDLDEEEDS